MHSKAQTLTLSSAIKPKLKRIILNFAAKKNVGRESLYYKNEKTFTILHQLTTAGLNLSKM